MGDRPHNRWLEREVAAAVYALTGVARSHLLSTCRPEYFEKHLYRDLFLAGSEDQIAASVGYDRVWTLYGQPMKEEIDQSEWERKVQSYRKDGYDPMPAVEQLRKLYVRRECLDEGRRLQLDAEAGDVEPGRYSERLSRLSQGASAQYDDSAREVCDRIVKSAQDGLDVSSLQAFGHAQLDEYSRGLRRDEFVVVAGQPGAGKTAFVLDLLRRRAERGYGKQLIFSMEMSKEQVVQRLVSMNTGIPGDFLTHGVPNERRADMLAEITRSIGWINDSFFIVDPGIGRLTRGLFKARVIQKIEEMRSRGLTLDCVMLDYLQLLGTGHEELTEWTRTLKLMCLEYQVPIFCISSLGRGFDRRLSFEKEDIPFLTPCFSDLRGCGNIEFDANKIWFLLNRLKGKVPVRRDGADKKVLYILKNRFGPRDLTINYDFSSRSMKFWERA